MGDRTRPSSVLCGARPNRESGGAGLEQATAGVMLHRWNHEIQIALLRRRAAMTRAVLPSASSRERWLVTGAVDGDGAGTSRAAPLDADACSDIEDDAGSVISNAEHTSASPHLEGNMA